MLFIAIATGAADTGAAKMVLPGSIFTEVDAGHGRVKERIYQIYRNLSFVTGGIGEYQHGHGRKLALQ